MRQASRDHGKDCGQCLHNDVGKQLRLSLSLGLSDCWTSGQLPVNATGVHGVNGSMIQ